VDEFSTTSGRKPRNPAILAKKREAVLEAAVEMARRVVEARVERLHELEQELEHARRDADQYRPGRLAGRGAEREGLGPPAQL